jgi:hypothetical protein
MNYCSVTFRTFLERVTGDVERLGSRAPTPLRDVLAGALKSPTAGTGEDA